MKIAELLLQTLERSGVRHIFGNPGTTEIPLVRMCERRERLQYVVTLSEVAAVPMADGYARANRSLGVVNLHVAPGLGNGMGGLYTAGIAKTPLLVLIGSQDRRFLHTAPILYGPLEAMAASVCKAVFGLSSANDAAANVGNAIRAALTPPFRPVALICPADLLEEDVDAAPATIVPARLGSLGQDDAGRIAELLCDARSPAFIAAEDVHWHRAAPTLRALAEGLDAPVYVAPYTGVLPIDAESPAYAGYLTPGLQSASERLAAHDALAFIGGRTLRTTLFSPPRLPQTKVWLGDDPTLMPVGAEFMAAHLVDLGQALTAIRAAAAGRGHGEPAARKRWRSEAQIPPYDSAVFHPTRAIDALVRAFPDALIFDEAGLSTSDVRQWMLTRSGDYMINGSGGIGWALAGSVGGAIARRDRQVVTIVGDGSSLYASEALWSAANQGTRLLTVVLSNRRYATLNAAATRLTGHDLDLFSIEPPAIDFSGLATLYGFDFIRARNEGELSAALRSVVRRLTRNTLLELIFDAGIEPVTASRHF
jgi:benzoylformate decarboxylase